MSEQETLSDVLRGLSDLAPHRFEWKERSEEDLIKEWCYVSLDGSPRHYWGQRVRSVSDALVQVACQQECEARGWDWWIRFQDDRHRAEVYHFSHSPNVTRYLHNTAADSPALAIATALRDALRAEADA